MAPSTLHHRLRALRLTLLLGVATGLIGGLVSGCVYRLDVQQGNLLEQKDIEAIQEGMTRSQVRFLLGTPVAVDPFRADRWDYMYYLKPGKSTKSTQRWVIVRFNGDIVKEIERDVPVGNEG